MKDESSYTRTARIALTDGSEVSGWLRVKHDPAHNALVLSMSESLLPTTSIVVARIHRMFDLDCDPKTVYGGLTSLNTIRPGANVCGTRLPGCFDPFETCCRAVLGQQVSVALPDMTPKERLEAVEPCRPWRSYAVVCLWNSLRDQVLKAK